MFIGHFGVGFGAKTLDPKLSLGTLFIASQFIDLLWPTFILLNVEQVEIKPGITKVTPLDFINYPFSHSLIMVIGWGIVLGLLYYLIKKRQKGAVIICFLVLSHWLLDFIVHRPDLPLAPGISTRVGLGLWNSVPGTILLEGLIFIAGVSLYLRKTKAKNKTGTYTFWVLTALLGIIYIANIFGPPPPDIPSIAWGGQLQWVFMLMAFWVDNNRISRSADQQAVQQRN
jgi:FtsH-binding integral membrane protein